MTRAAIYARVSSQAQRESHTIENQLRTLPAFVAARGWDLVGTFIDDGRSAKTGKLAARRGFADLLVDAERGKFDVLVVMDIDRLTRTEDMVERSQILGPFQRLGIKIVTPAGGELDMRTMLGELYVTLQAQFAAEENRKRAERIKAGKLRAIAEGRKPAGPTPFGLAYARATGTWSLNLPAATIVREVFLRIAGGESCVAIADDLARRCAEPSPRTGWSAAAVYRIVRLRTACGEWDADKARGATIRVPAIVTETEWLAAARALLAHKKRGLVRTKHVYMLEALATCGACGARIAIRSACGNRSSPTPAAYVCHARKLKRSCTARIVKCRELDDRVWAALCDEIEQPELLAALDDLTNQRAADQHDWARDVQDAEASLARLEKVESSLMVRFRRGVISEAALDKELVGLNRDRTFYRRQRDSANGAVADNLSARERLGYVGSLVAGLRAKLPTATPEQRRALLRELAQPGSVVIHDGRVHLDLHLLLRTESATSQSGPSRRCDPRLDLVKSTDYSAQHRSISIATLRIRRVA